MNQIFLTTKRAVVLVTIVTVAVIVLISSATSAQAGQTVAVTASVASSLSCQTDVTASSFGTLTAAAISTSTPATNVTNNCNSGTGCVLYVNDAGSGGNPGLYAALATGTPLIASVSSAVSTGTEAYGIQAATTSAGTGGTLAISGVYRVAGANVGGLTIAAAYLASSTVPYSSRIVYVTSLAAISGITKFGSYADTVTYSCLSN